MKKTLKKNRKPIENSIVAYRCNCWCIIGCSCNCTFVAAEDSSGMHYTSSHMGTSSAGGW
ncbi:MAG: hypothetical protein FWC32_00400 [Firmicutes bacterium]|nr:hypothetical protein [Bacillota bacterium]